MGLAERRALEKFKTTSFVEFSKQLEAIAQFPVTLEVKWDELATRIEEYDDKEAALRDYFEKSFGKTLLATLDAICVDDMGREALQNGLKKIEIKSDENAAGSPYSGFSFENGKLVLNMRYVNTDQVAARTEYLISLLENKL